MSAGLKLEAENFGKLTQTNESAALIGLFHGTTATKKNPYGKPNNPAKTVGVLGAGLMGAGVAQVSATRGHKVLLKDINANAVARGLAQIQDNLNAKVKKRRMSVFDRDNIVAQVTGLDNDGNWKNHFEQCDLVIEAVLEEMTIKHAVIKEFEAVLPKHAVIASNTSGLKVKDIASVAERPENVVGKRTNNCEKIQTVVYSFLLFVVIIIFFILFTNSLSSFMHFLHVAFCFIFFRSSQVCIIFHQLIKCNCLKLYVQIKQVMKQQQLLLMLD
jgi:predicted dinucleotide-binding enzyme